MSFHNLSIISLYLEWINEILYYRHHIITLYYYDHDLSSISVAKRFIRVYLTRTSCNNNYQAIQHTELDLDVWSNRAHCCYHDSISVDQVSSHVMPVSGFADTSYILTLSNQCFLHIRSNLIMLQQMGNLGSLQTVRKICFTLIPGNWFNWPHEYFILGGEYKYPVLL